MPAATTEELDQVLNSSFTYCYEAEELRFSAAKLMLL